MDLGNHIGGHRRPALSGATLDNHDPATGARLGTLPRSDADDVDAAVAAARLAAPGWAATPTTRRAGLLDALASALEARTDAFALAESLDTGKPLALARRMDITRAVTNLRFFAGALRHQDLPTHPMDGALNYTWRQPVGIVGLISPWNLPIYLLSWKIAPALAMGNAVIAKPSELTPTTATLLAELATEVGLPPGVLNVVQGLGGEVGQALVEHPEVRAISFTGGTVTGRKVAATAAPMLKKLSLELGGKNATIIFDDADLDAALAGAMQAGFTNQGEICLCGSRVLVQRAAYERIVEGMAQGAARLRVGDPRSPNTDVGALISHAHRAKVEEYLRLAESEGGTILCGGYRPDLPPPFDAGAFLAPALIAGLPPTCRTATEEIFGPVVTVHPFDTVEEALAMAHATTYGLSASIWTRDLGKAHRVAQALDVGMVWVNTWLMRDLRVPFGGTRDSGVGREGGRWSLDFFSESKNVCVVY